MLRFGRIQCFPLTFLSLAVNPGADYAWTAVIFMRGRVHGRNVHRLKQRGHSTFARGGIRFVFKACVSFLRRQTQTMLSLKQVLYPGRLRKSRRGKVSSVTGLDERKLAKQRAQQDKEVLRINQPPLPDDMSKQTLANSNREIARHGHNRNIHHRHSRFFSHVGNELGENGHDGITRCESGAAQGLFRAQSTCLKVVPSSYVSDSRFGGNPKSPRVRVSR